MPRHARAAARRRRRAGTRSLLRRLVYWALVLGLWVVIAVGGVLALVAANLPPIQSLEIPKRPPSIEIVGLDGKVLATRGEMHGATVTLKELPPYLPKAFIAIEDRRFYSHYGVDPIGLVRAVVANVLHRGVSQGGSTITQQLAKNLFLTQERTLWRKLQEVGAGALARAQVPKKEILELYLNRVYFGAGAYGVDAAAQRYFGKSARQVTSRRPPCSRASSSRRRGWRRRRNPDGAERRAPDRAHGHGGARASSPRPWPRARWRSPRTR